MSYRSIAILFFFLSFTYQVFGQISVDAGLTPAEDRIVMRLQGRLMERSANGNSMNSYILNTVLAYGYKNNLTLMFRNRYMWKESRMADMTSNTNGYRDLMVMVKYGLYRLNKPGYTVGIASTAGIDIPLGGGDLSNETWNLHAGLFGSYRRGFFAADLNLMYMFNGLAGGPESDEPGNTLAADLAFSRQFIPGNDSEITLAPVLEVNFTYTKADKNANLLLPNGEKTLFLSPGLKLTVSNFVLEGLLQIPVWQRQDHGIMEMDLKGIVGIRYMM